MDYLALTNRAIEESGLDLDLLTSVNFANPPRTIMYTRLKRWVNESYKQILLKRHEWYVLNERTVLTVRPRLRGTVSVPGAVVVGDELIGRDSGTRVIVRRVTTDTLDPSGDVYLDVDYVDQQYTRLVAGEAYNRLAPAASTNVFFLREAAGYDLSVDIPNLDVPNLGSMSYTNIPDNVVDNTPGVPMPLVELGWDDWFGHIITDFGQSGFPQFVSKGPDGMLHFWPRLDKTYSLIFDYSRKIPDLVNSTDQPYPIPVKYQDAIYWRAVMKYARFERKGELYLNAREEYRFYNNLMENTLLPETKLISNRFWAD